MRSIGILARLAVAAVFAAGLAVGAPPAGLVPPSEVRAATPALTLVSAASYQVRPEAGRVAVTVVMTATNHLHDTVTRRSSFSDAYLAVQPSTSGFKVSTTGSGSPRISVARKTSRYTILHLVFGAKLASGASRQFTLRFNLVDPGGAPDRLVRISPSLVSFYAWAFGTSSTPGSSVAVTFPAGYEVTVGRGPLSPRTNADGTQTWTSAPLADPLAFVADLTADRPSDYAEMQRTVPVGDTDADLLVRSWPDDTAWRDRVASLMSQALPVLGDAIGLPWPIAGPLIVQEALPRSTAGYAGLFDPTAKRIEVAYVAPAGVVLHEAAHAWLNGALVADRWAAEGFASYYAEVAATDLKVKITSPELTPDEEAAAIPLNAWGPIGSSSSETESYAYGASLVLARAIADRAGWDGLRRVWALAAAGTGAYQPASGAPEPLGSVPDWRGLLDLLEDATGRSYDDLWRRWVVRPGDVAALDARAAARADYARTVADAGPWQLPPSVRAAMRTWQFDAAERQLDAAAGVIRQRTALEQQARGGGLQLPDTLRRDFESGDLVAAAAEASAELAAAGAIEAATAARPASVPALDAIGLLGTDPDASLRTAATAFAAGDLDSANRAATDARTAWSSAAAVGRGRLISVVVLAVAVVLLASLLVGRRRRASRPSADGLHSRP